MTNVTALKDHQKSSPTLDGLLKLVDADLKRVNELILKQMESHVPMITALGNHLINAGGKRIRPVLTLASAQLCNYTGHNHIPMAACVEFIHSATLLHDDVVDESDLRRGLPTANTIWGNKASVLVGDHLFSRSFELMTGYGTMEVLKILSAASSTIAAGEVMQLESSFSLEIDEARYLSIAEAKTAALFAAACEIGAVMAERPAAEQEALRTFGQCFGIAFQIIDDVLDYGGLTLHLGKSIGDDFREGKVTLPVIYAYASGSDEDKVFWQRTLNNLEQNPEDLDKAVSLIKHSNAIAQCIAMAESYKTKACQALNIFPTSNLRNAFTDAAEFVVSRIY